VARKRGEKSDTTHLSSASAIVVSQQTKQGSWLRLRVTLASYGTLSGRHILCVNHVVGLDPTQSAPSYTSKVMLNNHQWRRGHRKFTGTTTSPQTAQCEHILLGPVKDKPDDHHILHSPSLEQDTPETKTTLSRRRWIARDMQLAWATDRGAYNWHTNGKPAHSCAPDECSKSYGQIMAADAAFIGYQEVNNCNQLQQLMNCDSSYMMTTQSDQSMDQSTTYVSLLNGSIAYN